MIEDQNKLKIDEAYKTVVNLNNLSYWEEPDHLKLFAKVANLLGKKEEEKLSLKKIQAQKFIEFLNAK